MVKFGVRRILLLILLFLMVFGGVLLYSRNTKNVIDNGKLKITASFYPYYYFVSQIGGDKVNVINITPAGAEPHDYEPTPTDIIQIESSKLFVVNGLSESWIERISNVKMLSAGDGLFKKNDPHVWLSLRLAKTQVQLISNAIVQTDPSNKDYYISNTNKLLASLADLDSAYSQGLTHCKLNSFVTSHAAFGYLASDYGLTQVPIAGLSPDSEPSLKQLAQIAIFARTNNIKYIFFESLVSPKLADTIASEVGAKTLVLNPLEGLTPDQVNKGQTYLTVMQENLKNLKIALQCQ